MRRLSLLPLALLAACGADTSNIPCRTAADCPGGEVCTPSLVCARALPQITPEAGADADPPPADGGGERRPDFGVRWDMGHPVIEMSFDLSIPDARARAEARPDTAPAPDARPRPDTLPAADAYCGPAGVGCAGGPAWNCCPGLACFAIGSGPVICQCAPRGTLCDGNYCCDGMICPASGICP